MDRYPHARDFAELATLAGLSDEEADEARRLLPSLRGERPRRPEA